MSKRKTELSSKEKKAKKETKKNPQLESTEQVPPKNVYVLKHINFVIYKSDDNQVFILKCQSLRDAEELKGFFEIANLQKTKKSKQGTQFLAVKTHNNFGNARSFFVILVVSLANCLPAISEQLREAKAFESIARLTPEEKTFLQPILSKFEVHLFKNESAKPPREFFTSPKSDLKQLLDLTTTAVNPSEIPTLGIPFQPLQRPSLGPMIPSSSLKESEIQPQLITPSTFSRAPIPPEIAPKVSEGGWSISLSDISKLGDEILENLKQINRIMTLTVSNNYSAGNELLNLALVKTKEIYQNYKIITNIDPISLEITISKEETLIRKIKNEKLQTLFQEATQKGFLSIDGIIKLNVMLTNCFNENLLCYITQTSFRLPEELICKIKIGDIEKLIIYLFLALCREAKDLQNSKESSNKKERLIFYGTQSTFDSTHTSLSFTKMDYKLKKINYNDKTLSDLIVTRLENRNTILKPICLFTEDLQTKNNLQMMLTECLPLVQNNFIVLIPLQTRVESNFSGAGVIIRKKDDLIEIKYIDPKGSCYEKHTSVLINKTTLLHYDQVEEDIFIPNLKDFFENKCTLPFSLSSSAKNFLSLLETDLSQIWQISLTITGLIQQKQSSKNTGSFLVANFIAEVNNMPREKWSEVKLHIENQTLLESLAFEQTRASAFQL